MTTRILFVCTGNIARSQIAEGLARALAAADVEVASGGTQPNPKGVHPLAVVAMRERGIDIGAQRSKHIEEVPGPFDYVVTLCDHAAQHCPSVPAQRARLHWSIPDPVLAGENPEKQRAFFARIRDDIERRLREWMAREGLLDHAR